MATSIAIQHPNIFYLNDNWSSNNCLEYWNKGNIAITVNNNTVYKTIYSPSPTGYVEPKSAAFTGFTSSGGNSNSGFNVSGSFNKGWNFYCQPNFSGVTIFFPAIGYRGYAIIDYSNSGRYWSAGPSSTIARDLSFYPTIVYPQYENGRDVGFLSRPVFE